MWKTVLKTVNRAVYGAAPTSGPETLDGVVLRLLDGSPLDPESLEGQSVLFVNVASRCGLTPQYEELVKLHSRFSGRAFQVIGVPCNQFLGQEPGTADEIASFCSVTYGVDFPLLEKQDVNGAKRSPLYQWLVNSEVGGGDDIQWNFEKFLVGPDAVVVGRFDPRTTPLDAQVVGAIESVLG